MIKVGIFWIYAGQVFGLLEQRSLASADSLGLIDSDFQHVRDWQQAKTEAGLANALAGKQYEDVLRGRLVFDDSNKTYITYSDMQQLDKSLRQKVKLWAGIENEKTRWVHDVHYTLELQERWEMFDDW